MKVALVQMTSTPEIELNLKKCNVFAAEAVDEGAQWIIFPENAPYLGQDRVGISQTLDGEIVSFFTKMAKEYHCWITLGSFSEKATSTHTYNTQVTVSPSGKVVAVYRKLHLFDVDLVGMKIHESDTMIPGKEVISFELDVFRVGASICYDLRFPELYRKLCNEGANVLIVPSAFTKRTGEAHWHTLLRARAIENQAYVLASNQFGNHFGDHESFGGSVVYDPWGTELVVAGNKECIVVAEIRLEKIIETRTKMPVLAHQKLF